MESESFRQDVRTDPLDNHPAVSGRLLGAACGNGYALGIMSGTSGDGIDVALLAVREHPGSEVPEITLQDFLYVPYTSEQRKRVFALFDPSVTADYVAWMHVQLGQWFGAAAQSLIVKSGVSPQELPVIGSHGQTVCHHPDRRFTLQIADPSIIAEFTGCAVVSDFRRRDMALGGQGAPLVPYFDYAYFRDTHKTRVLLNIGGISNLTVLRADGTLDEVIAFDTGPGNMVIDGAVSFLTESRLSFDEGGRLAAQGRVDHEWVSDLIAQDPYFSAPPPKSTGRERYGQFYVEQTLRALFEKSPSPERPATDKAGRDVADGVATLTYFVAKTIAQAIRGTVESPFELIVTGGGRSNLTLVSWLIELANPVAVLATEDFGVPSDAKEAMAFALFAWQFIHGRAVNVPAVTGAAHAVLLGQYTPARRTVL